MSPDDFCNDVDSRARPTMSRPRADGEPSARVTMTLRPRSAVRCQLRGRDETRGLSLHTRRRLFSPPGIFPDLVAHGHPLSLACTRPRAEVAGTGGSTEVGCSFEPHTEPSRGCERCLAAPKETNEPGDRVFTRQPCRVAKPRTTRESALSRPHPRCLPLARPLPSIAVVTSDRDVSGVLTLARSPARPVHTDTFVSSDWKGS